VVVGSNAGIGNDRSGQVRVDQEMLAERLGWTDAVPADQCPDRTGPDGITS
jgi:hypothetical protein